MTDRHPMPAPEPDAETEPFWAAAREKRFLLRHCTSCERTHWYPRTLCPFCFSAQTEWRESTGRGTIYSFTVMRRANPPYAIAYVALEEGPKLLTNLVDADLDALRIGQEVEVDFAATSGEGSPPVPVFRPV